MIKTSPVLRTLIVFCLMMLVMAGGTPGQSKTAHSNQKPVKKVILTKARITKDKEAAQQKARAVMPKAEEDEFEGNQEARDEWFIQQRRYPFDKIPNDARAAAWASRPATDQALLIPNAPGWVSIGPKPTTSAFPANWGVTSGRVNSIAVSPTNANIVLIGAAVGGVWRSTDGGTTFLPVTDNQVDMAVGSIAFAANGTTVYAGMGDPKSSYLGTGVLKSTDAGATWVRISNATLPTPGTTAKIVVDPTNANNVYVAQYTLLQSPTIFASGFYRSTDGGVNWTNTLQGTARDLSIDPTVPTTLYLSMGFAVGQPGNAGGVFKSVNSGATWTSIYTPPGTTANEIKFAVAPSNNQVMYVFVSDSPRARLESSTNGGASWTNLGSASFDQNQFGYNTYLAVSPTTPSTVFLGSRDVWKSTNSGVTFIDIVGNFSNPTVNTYTPSSSNAHPDQHSIYISPANPNNVLIGNDGGVWRSTDGGTTFNSLNNSLTLSMFVGLSVHPTNLLTLYGGTQDNGTQRRNGASTWQEFFSGDGGQAVIDAVDPTIVFPSYVNGYIVRYLNNGGTYNGTVGCESFATCATFNNDRIAFYPPIVGNGVNTTLYVGSYRLYTSTDRGATWVTPAGATDMTNGGRLSAIAVAPSNLNTIYTGSSDGRVMVSTDGGVTPVNAQAGIPNRFVKSITISKTNPALAYLTVSGYGTGHVFKTTNTGGAWTDISSNLPNIPANTLLIDPVVPTTLYVGTDVGIFRSTDDGVTWATFNSGMPPVVVSQLVAQASGTMFAATYGRGIYQFAPILAATVRISGRVMTRLGRGVGSAAVTLTDSQGVTRRVNTSARGYYGLDDVETGQTYVMAVTSRRFQFEPRVISITDNLANFDFIESTAKIERSPAKGVLIVRKDSGLSDMRPIK